MNIDYSTKMKDLRDLYELTQQDIANVLNIKRSTYNQYEQQYDIIPLKHLNTFCNYFNVSIDYMFNLSIKKVYVDEILEINTPVSAKRIKELRQEFKLTQSKLAKKLNVANTIISEYERGNFLISTSCLYSLSKTYNISSDYLLGKTNKTKYIKQETELVKN